MNFDNNLAVDLLQCIVEAQLVVTRNGKPCKVVVEGKEIPQPIAVRLGPISAEDWESWKLPLEHITEQLLAQISNEVPKRQKELTNRKKG